MLLLSTTLETLIAGKENKIKLYSTNLNWLKSRRLFLAKCIQIMLLLSTTLEALITGKENTIKL
jgi:hypothetical protein